MADYRTSPTKETYLNLRHGIRAKVLKHAFPNVRSRPGYPTTALCEMPSGRLGEVGYWELSGHQSKEFYGFVDVSKESFEPIDLARISRAGKVKISKGRK